ncbi:sensor histidine kinase [Aquimarina algicola]|uniref:histidine kinase n=1 Tax=Aquimarina algicola TaxID=2589995 RepID=A0A504JEM5_9FLAO|nr:ATP-binding protein [Aquimarina algicola]TPN86885.1 GHKL domain-containing protein [Aquimarina algicola]
MNSLLTRQIRKHLGEDAKNDPNLKSFLEAIQASYLNYEDQLKMLQRAMSISSQELYDANQKLKQEADQQKQVILSLKDATNILNAVTYHKENQKSGEIKELSGIELANHIEEQAHTISEIEKQREIILQDLEKSNKELRDYAHVVSHDLKSPLRNINALINWIKEDGDISDEITYKNLNLIDENIEKMDNLINGILQYSVIDKKESSASMIDLNQFIKEILSLIQIPEHIDIEIIGKLPVLKSHKLRLQQLFENLITNAIASIDKKEGMITIAAEEQEKFWQFFIKDNGKGIAEKYHQKIFKIFQSINDDKKSTGIGLSIVQKIVDFYGGKIWLTSELNKGTTFYFTLKK